MSPTLSVALCTYNGEKFLGLQLESLLNQSVQPDELIICDDASTDKTEEIAQAFAQQAPFPVRLIKNKRNLGYVKNFEQAISNCSGKLIFLCDQDDLWNPRKIERMKAVFDAEPEVGLVMHDFVRINAEGGHYPSPQEFYGENKLRSSALAEDIQNHSIRAFMAPYPRAWCGCMLAFRHDFLPVILPIYPGKGHDDWILKVISPLTQVRFIAKPLMQYRIHSSNTNSQEIGHSSASVFMLKLRRRFYNLRHGYSKKNFYREIISRIADSQMRVKYPELFKMYEHHI